MPRLLWAGIVACVALLNVDYLSTGGGGVAARYDYPLFQVFQVWWNLQQAPDGNTSLLLIDALLVVAAVVLSLFIDRGIWRIPRAVQVGSLALFPLGLYILAVDPGEFRDQFCKLCGSVTNEILLYSTSVLLIGSTLVLRGPKR